MERCIILNDMAIVANLNILYTVYTPSNEMI